MSLAVPPADTRVFAHLLAADLSWALLAELQRGDAQPDELSVAIGQPLTVMSPAPEQRRAFTHTITELAQRIRSLLIFIERDQRAVAEEVA